MDEFLLPYVLGIVINSKNQVLLIYRSATEFFSNHYALVGGKIDTGEPAKHAIIRELFEEINIAIDPQDAEFVHVMHFMGETRPCVSFFYAIRNWSGEIVNKEPDKHDHVKWFDLEKLPDDLIPRHRKALAHISKKIYYSEEDW